MSPFVFQKGGFHPFRARIIARRTIRSDNPVTGHENRKWIFATRGPHRSRRSRSAHAVRKLTVRYCRSRFRGKQCPPDVLSEGSTPDRQRQLRPILKASPSIREKPVYEIGRPGCGAKNCHRMRSNRTGRFPSLSHRFLNLRNGAR